MERRSIEAPAEPEAVACGCSSGSTASSSSSNELAFQADHATPPAAYTRASMTVHYNCCRCYYCCCPYSASAASAASAGEAGRCAMAAATHSPKASALRVPNSAHQCHATDDSGAVTSAAPPFPSLLLVILLVMRKCTNAQAHMNIHGYKNT